MEGNKRFKFKLCKDLKIWQKAADLATLVYKTTEKFLRSELYGLTSKMRRSAVSISSNIAEGFKGNHAGEKLQFYSVAELESKAEIALKLNFLTNEGYQKLGILTVEVGKMLDSLIRSVRRSPKSYLLNPIFFLIVLYSSISYILSPVYAQSDPRVYFSIPAQDYPPGSRFTVTVFADTDVPVNAVSLEIGYTANTLAFVSSDAGESWVSFWRNFPPSPKNGVLRLEGGMTQPFVGQKGEIIKLTFLATKEGPSQISFRKATFFAADGKGTAVLPTVEPLNVTISKMAEPPREGQTMGEIMAGIYDTIKPELADFALLENPEDRSLLLVFRPQDRESGIYNVTMRQRKWFLWEEEKQAVSPIIVEKGVWNIRVRAQDNAGNVTVKTIILWGEAAKKAIVLLIPAIVIVILILRFKVQRFRGSGF